MVDTIYTQKDRLHRTVSIRGRKGQVVVTFEGDSEDHIIGPGERLAVRPRGTMAIRPLSPKAEVLILGGKAGSEGRHLALQSS